MNKPTLRVVRYDSADIVTASTPTFTSFTFSGFYDQKADNAVISSGNTTLDLSKLSTKTNAELIAAFRDVFGITVSDATIINYNINGGKSVNLFTAIAQEGSKNQNASNGINRNTFSFTNGNFVIQ